MGIQIEARHLLCGQRAFYSDAVKGTPKNWGPTEYVMGGRAIAWLQKWETDPTASHELDLGKSTYGMYGS